MKKFFVSIIFVSFLFILFAHIPTSTYAAEVKVTKIPAPLPTAIIATSTFTRSLSMGSIGGDVLMLQKYLNLRGYVISKTGSGSLGKETTTFGSLTKKAVIAFQNDHRISPAVGYFGPVSKSLVLKLENELRLAKNASSRGGGGTGSSSGSKSAIANSASLGKSNTDTSPASVSTSTSTTSPDSHTYTPPEALVSSIARELSYGSEGVDVLALQLFLNQHGYTIEETSVYDIATFQAVTQFQTDYNLPASGYVGTFTLSVMNSIQNGTYIAGVTNADDQLTPISTIPILIQGR